MDLDKDELEITKLLQNLRKRSKERYNLALKEKELHDDISKLLERYLKESK